VGVDLSPSLLAVTAMTLCSAEVIQERPLSSREVKAWLLVAGSTTKWELTTGAGIMSCLH